MAPPRGKYQTKLNAVMFSMMLEEMLSGPCTAQALAEHTGMSILTIQRTLRVMHRRKLVRISGWERDMSGRFSIRVFAFESGKDAVKPAPKPRAQKKREWAQRKTLAVLAGLGAANDAMKEAA